MHKLASSISLFAFSSSVLATWKLAGCYSAVEIATYPPQLVNEANNLGDAGCKTACSSYEYALYYTVRLYRITSGPRMSTNGSSLGGRSLQMCQCQNSLRSSWCASG